MSKKYLPFIILLIAALLLFWIKKNQRGKHDPFTPHITVPAIVKDSIDRTIRNIVYSKHARCRMECRHIDESEVKEILLEGEINYNRIEEDSKGKTYPMEGITHDNQHVRIVFAPHENKLVVVTVIDLEKEWPCDCY